MTSAATSSAPWTLPAAMAWEFWRSTWIRLVVAFVGIACMNVLFYQLVANVAAADLPPAGQLNLFMALFIVDTFLIVECVSGRALEIRHFLLPLPTWKLALAKMAFPVTTASVLWIGISLVTLASTPRTVTGDDWPLLGPALVAATFAAWAMAILWLPIRPKALKWTVAAALLAGPIVFTMSRFSDDSLDQADQMWMTPTAGELAGFAALLVLAFGVAVFGAERARCGAALGVSTLSELVESRVARFRRPVAGSFRSPAMAQIWLEWRHKGWVVLGLVACGFAVMAARSWGGTPLQTVQWFVGYATLLIFLIPPLVGCLVGRFNPSSRDPSIDLFRASRPLSNRGLAYSILATGTLSLFATWATIVGCVVGALGLADVLVETGQTSHLDLAWQMARSQIEALGTSYGILAGIVPVGASWTVMSLVATVFLVGSNRLVAAFVFGPMALGIVAPFLFRHLDDASIVHAAIVGAWTMSASALAVTVIAFFRARKREEIGPRTPLVALALWCAAALLLFTQGGDAVTRVISSGTAIEWAGLALVPGVLALAAAPLAMAPLAVALNRHR